MALLCCFCCYLYSSSAAFIHLLNSIIIYSYFHEYSLIGWMLSMEYDIMNSSWLDRHRVGWIFCCRKSTTVSSIFASLEPYTYTIGAFLSGDETVNCIEKKVRQTKSFKVFCCRYYCCSVLLSQLTIVCPTIALYLRDFLIAWYLPHSSNMTTGMMSSSHSRNEKNQKGGKSCLTSFLPSLQRNKVSS